jgi:hypothetical protein
MHERDDIQLAVSKVNVLVSLTQLPMKTGLKNTVSKAILRDPSPHLADDGYMLYTAVRTSVRAYECDGELLSSEWG